MNEQLYGLMAIAKEHQAAAERAAATAQASAAALSQACQAFDQARAAMPSVAATAALEAARAALVDQGKETQRIGAEVRQTLANSAGKAANAIDSALRGINWLWVVLALVLGLALGGTGAWLLLSKRIDRIENTLYAIWAQTPDGQKTRE